MSSSSSDGASASLVAERQHAQVAEHLALVRQERRVAALAGAQIGELVGQLAVEELDRVGAGEGELAPLGAVDQAARRR